MYDTTLLQPMLNTGMIIYKIRNNINGKVYIGYDSKPENTQSRWKRHKGYGSGKWKLSEQLTTSALYRAMIKYGVENFSYEVIGRASTISELRALEIAAIAEHQSFGPLGYNMSQGGDGGTIFADLPDDVKKSRGQKAGPKVIAAWKALTEEQRQERIKRRNTTRSENLAAMSDEERQIIRDKRRSKVDPRAWWESLSDVEKQAHADRARTITCPEKRSEATKKVWAAMSEETKSKIIQKILDTKQRQTPEQKADIERRKAKTFSDRYKALSDEERRPKIEHNRSMARKFWDKVTPEQIAARSEKARLTRERKAKKSEEEK